MMSPDDGGLAARRAVLHWAVRSFRLELRQQLLVLGLLVVAVAAGIGFTTATYNLVGVPENAVFGSANHRFETVDARLEAVAVAADEGAIEWGEVDTVGEWTAAVPGSVESILYRAQDPSGAFSQPMLARLDGRYPTEADEVAVTNGVVSTLQLSIGGRIGLDGQSRTVVGIVENPSDLDEEFVLAAPTTLDRATAHTLLIGGTGVFEEVRQIREFGRTHLPGAELTTRADVRRVASAAAVVGTTAVVLVLVSLVASAAFLTLAQRRLRQLGMLSAVGATQRHVRLLVLANGAIVGFVAAILGAAIGIAGWLVAAPRMEDAAGFRIDPWNLPWVLIAGTVTTALVATIAAAWWPARSVAAVPTTHALAGRPSAPRPAHRSATLGILLAAGGIVLLAAAGDNPIGISLGTIAATAGTLALSPLAVSLLARVARGLPVGVRLAWRDLSRHRARSGLALAAISLALGIPAATAIAASAADATAPPGNLPEDLLLVWTREPSQPEGVSPYYSVDPEDGGFSPYLPDVAPAETHLTQRALEDHVAEQQWSMTPLEVVLDPPAEENHGDRIAITLSRESVHGYLDVALLYRATPQLLESYGLATVDGIATTGPTGPPDVVTDTQQMWLSNLGGPTTPLGQAVDLTPSYTSLPGTLVGDDEIRRRGWTKATVGWLLQAPDAFTEAEIAQLREFAAANELLVEDHEELSSLTSLSWGATGTGILAALAVLAMTVGLIRAESARDTRILVATGATSTIRRTLTASTAGGLAALGALVGTLSAYAIVDAGFIADRSGLAAVPAGSLALIVLATPVAATAAGWLLAGRTPTNIARPIE